ncbi:hypothetical protein BCF46_1079 [Litoreibacter meonggei]|uniref:Sulfotransferase family protein n=1 Tax=Litoreibacter meonggei TaxID=1049199 RepID=A0A497X2Z9_9RHOB|nr:hypothetical protein [Litoreibacter meonggei]RLJ58939.1 hypothetical protein BCF46_1079 [Litoreibacter meonggei]
MEIVLHVGAHSTDEDNLLKCLYKNKGQLGKSGIIVPEPSRYRPAIRETMQALDGDIAPIETQEALIDSIMDEDHAERVILSHESFLCVPGRSIGKGEFYPTASFKASRLRNLFSRENVRFCIALRNPATFIPTVFDRAKDPNFESFLDGTDPMDLRWSGLVTRLRTMVPDAPITVWCNEDTPLLWPQILKAVAGTDDEFRFDGVNDFLGTIMGRGGQNRLESYLAAHPPQTESQRERIIAAFLDKFGGDALEQEIDLPGWTEAYVNQLSELYERDVDLLDAMPGVTFMTP